MSKMYKTAAAAKTAATKLAQKMLLMSTVAVPVEIVEIEDAVAELPGQQLVVIEQPVLELDGELDGEVKVELPARTSLALVPAGEKQVKLVSLTLPVTKVSSTYVGAMHEGREVWFDKKSLTSWTLHEQDEKKMVSVWMPRSKAVRRKLIAAA
jgi:hypothetical protein